MVKVSVFMIAYNHEKYIGQAIESIVTQKTNFPFDLVIGEDCSPDGTRAICEAYAAQYPDIIKLLPSDRNRGPMANGLRTFEACTGEYIAMCEGDDYWISPLKLQKQVDFLNANPDYSMCFSDVEIVNEEGVPQLGYEEFKKDTYVIEDFITAHQNIVPTPSLMIRNLLPNPFPQFFREAIGGDMVIQLVIADRGKAKFINEKLAAYRNQSGGMSKSEAVQEAWREGLIKTYHGANEYLKYKYKKAFNVKFLDNAKWALMHGAAKKKGMERMKHYLKYMPQYIKYSDKLDWKELLYYNTVFMAPGMLKKIKK